jgi:nucleotide sugar dehydrogenase
MSHWGIIGYGFVGRATAQLFDDDNLLIYDIQEQLRKPLNITYEIFVQKCKYIFISVPTPMKKNGECYLGMVEDAITKIKNIDPNKKIIIRSTVPVGTCEKYGCYFMPEFLTERNWMDDFKNCEQWIFGGEDKIFKEDMTKLFENAMISNKIKYAKCAFCSVDEAEMIKLYRNNFLAMKVAFCNEFYDFCEKMDCNYENVRKLAVEDKRIGESHSLVPGLDGKRGFGGTCFPKDLESLIYQMKNVNLDAQILRSVKERNQNDRKENKDWEKLIGRSVL